MPSRFKLIKEIFSDKDQEWQWTYELTNSIFFNEQEITHLTVTDHIWKKKGRENITKEFILSLLIQISGELLEPLEYQGNRKPYEWEIIHEQKFYILFFWFDDHNPNGLWIRNCHWIDYFN